MAGIKSLMKDTAIYGVSSIIGKFLNWLLNPLLTYYFAPATFGVYTYVYSFVAIALLVLTYGLETGFFRFANHDRWKNPMAVYSTCLISLAVTSTAFIIIVSIFIRPVTQWMECGDHTSYILMMAVCVAADAFTALPFAYLRYRKRPVRFAKLKVIGIFTNIVFVVFFIVVCPVLKEKAPSLVNWFYNPEFGIGYVFLSNLIASLIVMLLLIPELTGFKWQFNGKLWREIIKYSAPLLVLGIAGVMNQTIDKILFPYLAPSDGMDGLGIYSANYKVAIVMVMFIQAFRFAYEPFIFSQSKEKGETKKQAYSDAMKYFTIFALLIFMGVMFYLDILKYFIAPRYFSGLKVIPIVMIAELFFGIFFNLSVWYKISDRTHWGMWFSLLGLLVTVGLNVLLVPRFGYMGCAWAGFACYGVMMVTSYFVGQAKYPINYHLKTMFTYTAIAAVIYVGGKYVLVTPWAAVNYIIRAILIVSYVLLIVRYEKIAIPGLRWLNRA